MIFVPFKAHVDAVASRARHFRTDAFGFREAVDEGALADVPSADDGELEHHIAE